MLYQLVTAAIVVFTVLAQIDPPRIKEGFWNFIRFGLELGFIVLAGYVGYLIFLLVASGAKKVTVAHNEPDAQARDVARPGFLAILGMLIILTMLGVAYMTFFPGEPVTVGILKMIGNFFLSSVGL